MVKYVKGNLFDSNSDVLAHGCNCMGGYGAGVAKIMAMKYPTSKNAYLSKHKTEGWHLGDVQFVSCGNKIIANCATQKAFGSGAAWGTVYLDYPALKIVLEKLYNKCKEENLSIS